MSKLELALQLWRHFGPRWLAFRLRYSVEHRLGLLRRRTPARAWEAQPLAHFLRDEQLASPAHYLTYRLEQAPQFFFAPEDRARFQPYFSAWDDAAPPPQRMADQVMQGTFCYFSHYLVQVGFPPDWHRNPFTGQATPTDKHWSQIGDFGAGDIKIIWELNRFGFVYALVRAYWRTGKAAYAEAFWHLVEDWRKHNSPQLGANWKCGQEIAFRVMAWCFGLYGFLDAASTTALRVKALAQMIAVSAQRITANLAYALSQNNNHGISEGLGLWTVGSLFPEFTQAARWQQRGRQVLEQLGRELIYDDGAFSQHSFNYQRLMLHDYLWAIRLADVLQQPFSEGLKERVLQAGKFFYQLQDTWSGKLSVYGQNDGSLILPLNNCDYQDYRPVIQAIHYLVTGKHRYPAGPWNEDLLWLFGSKALASPVESITRNDLAASVGGYYTLRSKQGFVFTRCAEFKHRPAHADLLHADVWWRGQNIALDPGTYSYNAPAPWDHPFAATQYHNTVTADGQSQMQRVGKFMWLPWVRGNLRVRSFGCAQDDKAISVPEDGLYYWEGQHDGYQRMESPVHYRRGILRLPDEYWLIVDSLYSEAEHNYRLHWLLMDMPYEYVGAGKICLQTDVGDYGVQIKAWPAAPRYALTRADATTPRGWRSSDYYDREPALSVETVLRAPSVIFFTVLGPFPVHVELQQRELLLEVSNWKGVVKFNPDAEHSQVVFEQVYLTGGREARLELD